MTSLVFVSGMSRFILVQAQDFPAVARIATLTNGLAVRSDRGINTLAGQYSLAAPLGPKEYALFIEAEIRKWAPVIKASGASFD